MSRPKTITYAIDQDTGLVISKLSGLPDKELDYAVPVLQYAEIGANGSFSDAPCQLEKMSMFDIINMHLEWTKKIPLEVKNLHRKFWGMTPLVPSRKNLSSNCKEILALIDENPLTEEQIAKATGRRKGKALPIIAVLVAKGLAFEEGDLWKPTLVS